VHAEQGFGDTLQMCRFVPLIRDAGHILFEAPAPLVRLLQRLAAPAGSEIDMVERGSDLPPADFQCPVMSLPAAFGMATATDVPKLVPYLTSDPGDVAAWQRRLAPLAGWRIGLCWSSGTRTDLAGRMMQARKSLPLSALAPLGSLANCSFVSLQTGAAASDIYAGDAGFPIIDVSANLADFADTAALIQCLDLVVTIDTAVAHLAGALGAPTAVLLHSSADWRWSASQASAPWYPTCTLFRQARQGNWEDVVAGVCGFADGIRQIAPLF
jgi:hypothetical protein